ncbi:hypothetical protein GCM10020229_84820 [Kitasatospora albolonga]
MCQEAMSVKRVNENTWYGGHGREETKEVCMRRSEIDAVAGRVIEMMATMWQISYQYLREEAKGADDWR